jgi:hypothetical protein
VVAVAWGAFTKLTTGTVADVSTMVIVMSAVQVGVVGLLAELINRRLPSHFKQERQMSEDRRRDADARKALEQVPDSEVEGE